MGFFSGEDKKTVFANTCHLAQASTGDLQDAVLYAVLSGGNIASSILNTVSNRMSNLAENFRTYAKDHYTLGLPKVAYTSSVVLPEEDVEAAITEDTSRPYGVVLDFHYVAPLVPLMAVAPYLFSVRGWDPDTNIISVLPSKYQRKHPWDRNYYEGSVYDIDINDDYTSVTITYQVDVYQILYTGDRETLKIYREPYRSHRWYEYFTDTQALPAGLYYGREYCVAAYHVLDSEGSPSAETYWWYYDTKSGIYPALTVSASIDEENNLFPIVPIRWKNKSMVREEVQDTELYKTSKTLLKKLGLDIHTIAEKLEENPDVDEIDHAYVVFGVDLQTEEIASIRYLAEFFDQVSDKGQASVFTSLSDMLNFTFSSRFHHPHTVAVASFDAIRYTYGTEANLLVANNEVAWTASDGTTSTINVTVNESLGDFEEYGLHMEMSYSYIRSEIIAGSIGDIGHATKEWEHSDSTTRNIFTGKKYYDDAAVIFKVQVAENAYKQVKVKGLTLINHVCKNHYTVTTLSDVIMSEDEHNLIIPLHYNLTKKIPSEIRNQLYQDSLLLVMNSVVVTHVAWYASGFFKFIVMVVGIVLSIYTGGVSGWFAGLATAAAEGAVAVLMYLLESIILAIAIQQALNYVAKWIGPEAMAILSVVTIAVAGLSKMGAFEGIAAIDAYLPSAGKLLALSTSMLSSASNAYSYEIEGIQEDYEKETAKQEALWEELEDYSDLLEDPTDASINLLEAQTYSKTLRQPRVNDPGEFYDIAIHTGNIGTLALQSPYLFHNLALTLPKPDTLLAA